MNDQSLGRVDRSRQLVKFGLFADHESSPVDPWRSTGLMTRVAHLRARVIGAEIDSVLLDIDLPALKEARKELPPGAVKGCVCASADRLPFAEAFDMAVFANSLHLLDDQAKVDSLAETSERFIRLTRCLASAGPRDQ